MDILLVTSEIAPYSQVTAAAQSVASLAKALRGLHHKVTVISPLYASIDPVARSLARRLSKIEARVGERSFKCEIYDGRTTGGVDLIFVGEPSLFATRAQALSVDSEEDAIASAVFCQAAGEIARLRDPQPDVIHAFGAAAALSLVRAKAASPNVRTVLSIHDELAIGRWGNVSASELGVPATPVTSSLLAAGAACADRVVLRSPSVADRLLGSALALDGTLAAPGRTVSIIEGVDAAIWNPLTDAALSARFDPMDLTGKRHCKAQLQRELQLPERSDVPLLVAAGTLDRNGGGDRLVSIASDLLNNDMQIAIITRGEPAEIEAARKLQERFSDRIAVRVNADDAAMHQALSAADLLVFPAFAEPAEQLHRCAQRYGALPIVARAGGVGDTVVDCDPELVTGNGFVFDDEASLLPTVQRGLAAFARSKAFEKLRVRVMRVDSSWERTARLYEQAIQPRKPAS